MDELHSVPRDMDAPVPILFWDPPEFVLAVLMVGLCLALDHLGVGIILATITLTITKKLKEGSKRQQSMHMLWRIGLGFDSRLAHFPKPTQNEFYS